MATTHRNYTGDGNATKQFTFPSYQESDVKVRVDGVLKTSGTHYNITGYSTTGGGNIVFTSGNIPSSPAVIRIYRDTSVDAAKATFTAGSSVKAADLNNNTTQLLYRAQEEQVPNLIQSYDIGAGAVETSNIKDDSVTTAKIPNNAVTTAKIPDDAITVDKLANNSVVAANIQNGQVGTVALADDAVTTAKIVDDSVTTAKIPDNAILNAKIANDQIDSRHYVDGSIDTQHIANGQITSAKMAFETIETDDIAADAITTAKIPNDAITNAKIGNDQIDSRHYVDGSIDTAHISNNAITTNKITNNAVTTDKILDNAITTSKIASQQVTGAKIANLQVGTSQLSDAGVTTAKLANGAVTTAKIADSNITTAKIANSNVTINKIADGNVTTSKLANNAVTTDKITDLNVTTSKIAHDAINSNKLANDAVVTAAIADNAVTTAKINGSAVTTARIANGAVTTDKIAASAVGTARIADDAVTSAKLANQAVDTAAIATGAVVTGHLAGGSVTSAKIQDGTITSFDIADSNITTAKIASNAVTTAKIADNAVTADKIANAAIVTNSEQASHTVNDTTFFTTAAAEARYFNASTGETIKNGQTFPDNDTTIATTAAINDRIIDLVDDVGGFVPIANETSFPTANPDVNNGSGTLVSIKAISSTRTPSSGTVTIANGAGTGNTVTITGCGSTVLTSGFGVIVETTSTLHTYAFHRLVPKATEVTTVASNITNIVNAGSNTTNINTVAGNSSNITTVAGISGNVTTVAGISSNVTDVANNATNINSVQSNASNINTVAGIAGNVTTVANNSSNVTSVANNMANVNNFNDRYQIASNNPSTDGGGNALAAGDLYFNTSANELKVYTGSAWQGGVTATGNFASVTGNTFTGDNTYNDGVEARFGTGGDLRIEHTGQFSKITNTTGALNIFASNGGTIGLFDHTGTETLSKFTPNGATELYYDNGKKLETTSYGIATDTVRMGGFALPRTQVGGSDFLTFGHGGSFGELDCITGMMRIKAGKIQLANRFGNVEMLTCNSFGSVEMFHNGSKKVETTSTGVNITGVTVDDGATHDGPVAFTGSSHSVNWTKTGNMFVFDDDAQAKFGDDGDFSIRHASGTSILDVITSNNFEINHGSENIAKFIPDGAVELYYDNTKKFETQSTGTQTYGTHQSSKLKVNAVNAEIDLTSGQQSFTRFGAINHYHNNSTSNIHNQIKFTPRNGSNGRIYFKNLVDGTLETKLLIDAVDGLQAYDHFEPATNDTYNLGSASKGFANVYADHLNITGLSTFSASGSALRLNDGSILRIGNADDDYFLHYDNAASTAYLSIGTSRALRVTTDDFRVFGAGNTEQIIRAQKNGAVSLFYDNSVKLATINGGISVTGGVNTTGASSFNGDIFFADNKKTVFGAGSDLQIFHNGTDSKIHNATGDLVIRADSFKVRNGGETEKLIDAFNNGDVELYYDDSKKLETAPHGVTVQNELRIQSSGSGTTHFNYLNTGSNYITQGDSSTTFFRNASGTNRTLILGNGNWVWNDNYKVALGDSLDLQLYHDGSNSVIQNNTGYLVIKSSATEAVYLQGNVVMGQPSGGGDIYFEGNKDGSFEAYYDNSRKFETRSGGAAVFGHLELGDDDKVMLGDSNDLQIFHDGANSRISDNGTGNLMLDGNEVHIQSNDNAENQAKFKSNADVELYYDNSQKFTTASNGAIVYNKLGIGVQVGNSLGNRTYAMAIGDNDTGIAQNGDGILEFWSNNQVKGTIAQGGNGHRVMFNHSDTSSYNAHVSSRQNSSGPYPFGAIGQSTNQGFFGFFNSGGSLVGNIAKSGNSTQYNTSSDYRLKEDDTVISDGITRLKQLRPIRFKWKEFPEKGHQDGFFAHEVSSVVPEAVNGEKDAVITQEYIDAGKEVQNNLGKPLIQLLDNSKLIPLITAALRDAVAKIETLETKVAALEAA